MSQPAQSRPWAMRDYPQARRREVEALLELADLEAGIIFLPDTLTRLLADGGFEAVEVKRRDVPWQFAGSNGLVRFCRGLFGLECPDEVIAEGIENYLCVRHEDAGVALQWHLLYARARKPE